jgi:CheY-like chemotaxis protein
VLLRELLRAQGHAVELAVNGQEALEYFGRTPNDFAVIILDLHMPVLDGLQAAQALRALPEGQDIPLVAMSAETPGETRQKTDALGFNHILSKPIDPQQLFELVRTTVNTPVPQTPALPLPPFPTLKGIDTAIGLSRTGHNRSLYARLLLTFLKTNQQTPATLAAQCTQPLNPSVRGRIHTLKGAAGSIGARQVHSLAEEVLEQLHNPDRAACNRSLQQLADALSACIGSITQALPALEQLSAATPATSSAAEGSPTHTAIALLRQQLEEFDTGALESFARLRPQLDWLAPETIEALQQALERYDFETASSLLNT